MITGPSIIADESLVFGYMANDKTSRFYKGEPTTNLVTHPENPDLWLPSELRVHTSVPYENLPGDKTGLPINCVGYKLDSTCNASTWSGNAYGYNYVANPFLTAGTDVTFSVWCYVSNDFNGTGANIDAFGPWIEYNKDNKGTWQKLTGTKQMGTSEDAYFRLWMYKYGGTDFSTLTGYVIFYAPQLELKDHAAQFVNGTRLSTESLYDLSGNNHEIDLANMSFDGTGHPYWDGSTDWFQLNDLAFNPSGGFTIDCWIKLLADPYLHDHFTPIIHFNSMLYGMLMEAGTTGITLDVPQSNGTRIAARFAGSNLMQNQWTHVVFTWQGGVFTQYKNGVELAHTTAGDGTAYPITSLRIGEIYGYYQNMSLPELRIYNRALSASEITQNYNAHKSLYGL